MNQLEGNFLKDLYCHGPIEESGSHGDVFAIPV